MIAVEVTGLAVPRLGRGEIARFTRRILRAVERADAAPFVPTEVSIAFVDDRVIRSLNRRYRRKNRTTDILTFGAEPEGADRPRPLGELVISLEQARRQARRLGHSTATEIRYLIVHGMLHAFGYDHETDHGQMDALELRIRQQVGLD